MMSKYIIIDRKKLDDLRVKLLALRDFIQDLEFCMKLLNIPLEKSTKDFDLDFLEYLIDIAIDQFPPDRCQDFKELTDKARYIIGDLLKKE